MEADQENMDYSKRMGSYRPHFQGKPDDYYELDCKDVVSAVGACFLIVVIFFFLTVGLFFWSNNVSTQNLVLVWSIVLCVFVPAFMVAAYYGSNNKMEVEEKLIKDALRSIMEKKEKTKLRYEERREGKNELSMSTNKIFMEGGL